MQARKDTVACSGHEADTDDCGHSLDKLIEDYEGWHVMRVHSSVVFNFVC